MKKILIFILIFVVLIPLIMWLLWILKKPRPLNLLILDKTVLTTAVQEHLSLSWVINNEKFVHDNKAYSNQKDYYGFFPDDKGNFHIRDFENFSANELNNLAHHYDAAYYTDMYGIYTNEWITRYYPEKLHDRRFIADRSRKIYGGMTRKELDYLRLMKQNNKLIINEFNIIASPTSKEIRTQYENEFNIHWTGWVGRYFDNLDTLVNADIPRWLIDNYTSNHNGKWPFKKSGIAFVSENDQVLILEKDTHLNIDIPFIYTNEKNAKHYHLPEKIKYPFWFDVIEVSPSFEVISSYRLDTNNAGDSLLALGKIPKVFPAAVNYKNGYNFYYFCGDFADNPISYASSRFRLIEMFSSFSYSSSPNERNSFFWKYYRPLLQQILNEEYEQTE
ncbi:MAG: hypothetical protein KBG17_08830 [Paludibacteraceae bacterium]|jgi:hypothetical protein|nr:hypothetical protein [Paludibacteraceae bacterium]